MHSFINGKNIKSSLCAFIATLVDLFMPIYIYDYVDSYRHFSLHSDIGCRLDYTILYYNIIYYTTHKPLPTTKIMLSNEVSVLKYVAF